MFQVILREAVRITRKQFVSLPPAGRQSIKPVSKVNWYCEWLRVRSSPYRAREPEHMGAAQPGSEDMQAVASMQEIACGQLKDLKDLCLSGLSSPISDICDYQNSRGH